MNTSVDRSPFQLEPLETRTLLAGDADAILSSGEYVSNFDPATVDSVLAIASKDGGTLTINSTLLPETITSLKISGFSSVTVTGSDSFREVYLWDIGSFSGAEIDVTSTLTTHDVDSLKVHSIAGFAWLYGDRMQLEVVDARSVTILSALESLKIVTKEKFGLMATPGMSEQEVRYDFSIKDADIPASMKAVLENVPTEPTKPTTPTTPTTPSEGGTTNPPTYLVIVIVSNSSSAATNATLLRLQDALKAGDAASIKQAFAAYAESLEPAGKPSIASAAANALAASNSHIVAEEPRADDHAETTEAGTPVSWSLDADLRFASRSVGETIEEGFSGLAASPAQEVDLGTDRAHVLAQFGDQMGASTAPRPHSDASDEDSNTRSEQHNVIQGVRSTLAGLVSNMDSSIHTVSAYIVDRVGTDLSPGELPGLLVEPRASRGRRDAADWVEI